MNVTLPLTFWDGHKMMVFEENALREKYFGVRQKRQEAVGQT